MPVVVLRGSEQVFQKAKINTGIRMDQHCVDGYKNNVYIKNSRWKAKYIQWDKGHRPGEKYIHKMGAATGKPIHILCRMVDRVETP